jgi:single-stranded DNA-specific DHH superfamily exonuclease
LELKKNQSALIIDHHLAERDLSSKNVVHYNIRFSNQNAYQPASYLVYKIFETELRDLAWIAALGTVADYGFEDCLDLLNNFVKVKSKEKMADTKIMKVANMVNSAIAIKGCYWVVERLFEAPSIDKIKKDKEMVEAHKIFEQEMERCRKEYFESAEKHFNEKVIIGSVNSKYSEVASTISSALSSEAPDKIFIVLEKRGKNYKISSRTQLKDINLGEILHEIARRISLTASGGGHPAAGGAKIAADDLNKFKKLLLGELEQHFK